MSFYSASCERSAHLNNTLYSAVCTDELRLLPTETFTVIVEDEAELHKRKQGCVLARVTGIHPPQLIKAAVSVRWCLALWSPAGGRGDGDGMR
jgi:hypothetical protein